MTLRSLLRAAAMVGTFLALAQGCILVVEYDPLGNDATVEGQWTIDGAAPTAASCSALGIDTVRVVFYDRGTAYRFDSLSARCEDGRIDTRPVAVLAAGTYTVRFEAYRGATLVGQGNMQDIRATIGGHVILAPADFVSSSGFNPIGTDATVEGAWTIDGATPTVANCSALGIDTVRIAFYNGMTPFYDTTLEAACGAGVIAPASPILRAGSYTVRFEAFRGSTLVGQGNMQTINVSAGGHVILAPADFVGGGFNPLGSDATLELSWTLSGDTPTPANAICFAVALETVRVVFYEPSDTGFANGRVVDMAPCSDGTISRTMPTIRAGEYVVAVESIGSEVGTAVDRNVLGTITVPPGSHIDLGTPNWNYGTVLTVQMDFTRPDTGTPGDCAAAGVEVISYALRSAGGTDVATSGGQIACGEIVSFDDSIMFGGGMYSFYFEGGWAGDPRKPWMFNCTDIRVNNGSIRFVQCVAPYLL